MPIFLLILNIKKWWGRFVSNEENKKWACQAQCFICSIFIRLPVYRRSMWRSLWATWI